MEVWGSMYFDTQNDVPVHCGILQSRSSSYTKFRPNCVADAHLAIVFKVRNFLSFYFILEITYRRPSMHVTRLMT